MPLAENAYEFRTLVNIRDLGGLPSKSGPTRPGVLLRSDAPYRGDDAPQGVTWPPSTVVDLRDLTEGADTSYDWPEEVERVSNPLFTGARLDRAVDRPLIEVYQTVLATAAPRVVSAINQYSQDGATVVHCAAGKDRTGIVAAVSLMLAGVESEAIAADYQRTEEAIGKVYTRMRERQTLHARVDPDHQIFRSPRPAIDLVLETVGGAVGGPWGWFETNGGDIERLEQWRERFVEAI